MILTQAITMMRQHKLFTAIYIAGTALAISFTMVLFILYYIRQTSEMRRANYIDIVKAVRSLPEVEYYCIAAKSSIPGSSSSTDKGTLELNSEFADWITFVSLPELGDEQPFATLGIEDAATGETIVLPSTRGSNDIYVSEEYAKTLYGTAEVKGREVEFGSKHIIAGVYKDYKTINKYYTPLEHSIVTFTPQMRTAGDAYQDIEDRYHLVIRLKEGVNRAAFEKRFNEEIAPPCATVISVATE